MQLARHGEVHGLVPVGPLLLRGAGRGHCEHLPRPLTVIGGQHWGVNLDKVLGLEILVNSLTGRVPDPQQAGDAISLGFTSYTTRI